MSRKRSRSPQGRPYVRLGYVMDELARERDVRGPQRIASYMEEKLADRPDIGRIPTGTAVAKWMYGDAEPKPDKIEMFAEAFELTEQEKMRLAWAYAYKEEPPSVGGS